MIGIYMIQETIHLQILCLKHPLTLSTAAHSQILTLYQDQVCDWHTNLATPTRFCFNTDLGTEIHLFLLICYELNIDG